MATTISVGAASTFVQALESGFQGAVSGFEGFGSDIKADIAAGTADVGVLANIVLSAFTATGNGEAAVLSPLINGVLSVIASLEKAAGFGGTVAAPATVTAAASTLAPPSPTATPPATVATPTPAAPAGGDDGLGDSDADTGAL